MNMEPTVGELAYSQSHTHSPTYFVPRPSGKAMVINVMCDDRSSFQRWLPKNFRVLNMLKVRDYYQVQVLCDITDRANLLVIEFRWFNDGEALPHDPLVYVGSVVGGKHQNELRHLFYECDLADPRRTL